MKPLSGVGVVEIMEALAHNGALGRDVSGAPASGKAQVRPKNQEKCAFILNCVAQERSDARKPQGFSLPQIEEVRNSILLGGRQIELFLEYPTPKKWEGEFSVWMSDSQYTWHLLLFRWKYSPIICQRLVSSVVRTSIWHLPVLFSMYLADVGMR